MLKQLMYLLQYYFLSVDYKHLSQQQYFTLHQGNHVL